MNRAAGVGLAVIAFCLEINPVAASAQATNTGALVGVVRDTTGAVLPGVTVEASSPALIEKVRTVATDAQGQYRIIDLRPGSYTVTFLLPGFSTFKRDRIEITTNFTATVNAELRVGSLEETVTVSGQTPLVDVESVVQQRTISRDVLDTVPTNRSLLGFAALTPQAILPANAQDVGGSQGELSVRMAVHGSKQTDQKLMMNGMRFNHMLSDGTSRSFYINAASAQEVVISLGAGGGLAEQSVGGVLVNVIPKDGGNRFSSYFYTSVTGEQFQSNNLTPELIGRGLPTPTTNTKIYDYNAAFGGPIRRDKLWFFSAHRWWGNKVQPAGLFHDSVLEDFIFTPDPSRPAHAQEVNESHNLHLTFQATKKSKVSLFYDWQHNRDTKDLVTSPGTVAWEAVPYQHRQPSALAIASWTYPATNKILIEGAWSVLQQVVVQPWPEGVSREWISVLEQSNGFRYRAPTTYQGPRSGSHTDQRFSVSYITGAHQFKTGLFAMEGRSFQPTFRGGSQALAYTFSNGRPIQLTQYADPITTLEILKPELGLYAQDQWRIKRATLNLGLRFETIRSYVPASSQPAGLYIDARSFDRVDCTPCWWDFSPRLGLAYDLFGDSKTAVKVGFGRYTASRTVSIAAAINPVNSSVNQVNRSWGDANGNLIPDCNLRDTEANGECGRMSNVNFGKRNVTTRYDPDYLNGWRRNVFNWQTSAVIEHQLNSGLTVSAGYFRTWYGNFTVTDNLEVTPQDFDPYCITAPSDSRLPGGGNRICGLYNVRPAKFGLVNNLVLLASNYGNQTEVYNGADFNFSIRLPRGGQVAGGMNIGNSISNIAGGQGLDGTTAATNRCFVVDSPQELYQCEINPPYQKHFKVSGSYPLGWGLQASANFQSLAGAPYGATYNATSAEIAPSLGRPLSGSVRTVPIALIPRNSAFLERINQIDLRMSKTVRVRGGRIQGIVDVYNALNASTVLDVNSNYGPDWLRPNQILGGRLLKFGAQLDF